MDDRDVSPEPVCLECNCSPHEAGRPRCQYPHLVDRFLAGTTGNEDMHSLEGPPEKSPFAGEDDLVNPRDFCLFFLYTRLYYPDSPLFAAVRCY